MDIAIPMFFRCIHLGQELIKAWRIYSERYSFNTLIPAVIGLFLAFFGGTFCTLIVAFEAARLSGWQPIFEVWVDSKNVVKGIDSACKNNYKAITKAMIIQVALSEVDPLRVASAFKAIRLSLLAITAALNIHFAKTITLGLSMADAISPIARSNILPYFQKGISTE